MTNLSTERSISQRNHKGGEGEIPKGGWRGGEGEIPKGGWRASTPTYRDVYRTNCGELFEFAFYLVNGSYYHVDILGMPSYRGRSESQHSSHRKDSIHGNDHRICVGDDSSLVSLEDAKHWACQWAEHSMAYINYGTPFPTS